MGRRLKLVDLAAMYHLMDGLTFKVRRCADVLDAALVALDKKTGVPRKIFDWNQRGSNLLNPPSFHLDGRLIVTIEQSFSPAKGNMYLSKVRVQKGERETAPVVFFEMHSPTLNIPMRVEVPLRALVKGGKKLKDTHTVYLHALLTDTGDEYVYYGITKRGWSLRFHEHVKSALSEGSRRLFPRKLDELIDARAAQISGVKDDRPKLSGFITAICVIGLDEKSAMDVEEYLVDKYSLSSKHSHGLNMIPGGYEGIRALHRLSLLTERGFLNTDAREELLEAYLQQHPQLGIPKPGVAEKWNDPSYAEAVICGRENRLDADQVREIRYLSALGYTLEQITKSVEAINTDQVRRVLEGITYTRVH